MKLTFGKYKGHEEETIPSSYLYWASLNVSFYTPSETSKKRIETYLYNMRQTKYRNKQHRDTQHSSKDWDQCSTLELMTYAC